MKVSCLDITRDQSANPHDASNRLLKPPFVRANYDSKTAAGDQRTVTGQAPSKTHRIQYAQPR